MICWKEDAVHYCMLCVIYTMNYHLFLVALHPKCFSNDNLSPSIRPRYLKNVYILFNGFVWICFCFFGCITQFLLFFLGLFLLCKVYITTFLFLYNTVTCLRTFRQKKINLFMRQSHLSLRGSLLFYSHSKYFHFTF